MSNQFPISREEPQLIAAGDAVQWQRQINDYPPPTYTLKYVLRNQTNIYKFQATNDAGIYDISLTSAETAAWKPGLYFIDAYVTDGTTQVQVRTAYTKLEITQNVAVQPTGGDPRTWAEKALASVEDTILKLTSRTIETANVNGQMYSLSNIAELFKLRERFRSEVRREEQQARLDAGKGAGNKIGIRFKRLATIPYPWSYRPPWQ